MLRRCMPAFDVGDVMGSRHALLNDRHCALRFLERCIANGLLCCIVGRNGFLLHRCAVTVIWRNKDDCRFRFALSEQFVGRENLLHNCLLSVQMQITRAAVVCSICKREINVKEISRLFRF